MKETILIVGGGAAGFFAAINIARKYPSQRVVILEKSDKLLYKVKISGGGRCNLTHHCFEPLNLVKNYPRGAKSLISIFSRFQPKDTIKWFEERGVKIKCEPDGRMFPSSDSSQSIIDCFMKEAKKYQVEIIANTGVDELKLTANEQWLITTNKGDKFLADRLVICTGSHLRSWKIIQEKGHRIEAPVPSLFTFNTKDTRLKDLMGTTIEHVSIQIKGSKFKSEGPLLITHWGLSGPAILKLSAWAARELESISYHFTIMINWTKTISSAQVMDELKKTKMDLAKKQISNTPLFGLSTRMWASLLVFSTIPESKKWADITAKEMNILVDTLTKSELSIFGKSTNKDEFVTCGGISLQEIDFKTMQSKIHPNLFFAGEVIDVDAITGGFNFQAAWSTAWVVSENING